MGNLFDLDFSKSRKMRLEFISNYRGKGFFSGKEKQFKCVVCGVKLQQADRLTCSAECAEKHKAHAVLMRYVRTKRAGINRRGHWGFC